MTKRSRDAAENLDTKTVADLLLLFSCGVAKARTMERTFQCKTCSRRFATFQALGGHCTTHKRSTVRRQRSKPRPKVHECTVCGMEFSMGQALGGHMRRHKQAPEALSPCRSRSEEKVFLLDLNSPPPEDELEGQALFFGESPIVHFLNFI